MGKKQNQCYSVPSARASNIVNLICFYIQYLKALKQFLIFFYQCFIPTGLLKFRQELNVGKETKPELFRAFRYSILC